MTIQDAISELKDSIQGAGYQCRKETYEIAIRSLEAWDDIHEDIDNYILNMSDSGDPYKIGKHDAAISIIEHILEYLGQQVVPHENVPEDNYADKDT